jgi:hypothetical protein
MKQLKRLHSKQQPNTAASRTKPKENAYGNPSANGRANELHVQEQHPTMKTSELHVKEQHLITKTQPFPAASRSEVG